MTSGENRRKLREAKKDFKRSNATRKRNLRILILTEGEKTEPLYLKKLCEYFGLNGVKINENSKGEPCKTGLDPKSIAKLAKKEASVKEGKKAYYWDAIYCVFDRDRHVTFHDALDALYQTQKTKSKLRAIKPIVSDICFELWYLLHFKLTTKQFICCNDVIKELKKVKIENNTPFKDYKKGSLHYFDIVKAHMPIACKNAQCLANEKEKVGVGPYTDLPILIAALYKKAPQKIKNELRFDFITQNT